MTRCVMGYARGVVRASNSEGLIVKPMICAVMIACLAGCAEEKVERAAVPQKLNAPLGTWFMYAGSETGMRTPDDVDREITILALDDSTYSLTMMEPHIQRNFVEKGQVSYDLRNEQIKFTVHTATGADFSGAEPRKLLDIDQLVPWQRDPGTEYVMVWHLEQQRDESSGTTRDVMALFAEGYEKSYFVRLEDRAKGAILDAQMK